MGRGRRTNMEMKIQRVNFNCLLLSWYYWNFKRLISIIYSLRTNNCEHFLNGLMINSKAVWILELLISYSGSKTDSGGGRLLNFFRYLLFYVHGNYFATVLKRKFATILKRKFPTVHLSLGLISRNYTCVSNFMPREFSDQSRSSNLSSQKFMLDANTPMQSSQTIFLLGSCPDRMANLRPTAHIQ